MEIFSIQSSDAALRALLQRDAVEVWSAGAEIHALPPGFATQEGAFLLARGRLQLDTATAIDGPAVVFLDAGTALVPCALDASVRLLLWSIATRHPPRPTPPRRPRIVAAGELDTPRTWPTSAALVHWLPRLDRPARRTLVGAPSLILNLGRAAVPLVVGAALHPLPGGAGAWSMDVLTLTLRPGSGPMVAVEQIELAS